jgi:hypothetical protein
MGVWGYGSMGVWGYGGVGVWENLLPYSHTPILTLLGSSRINKTNNLGIYEWLRIAIYS